MNVLALCAGVGGLELGVKLANPTARCVCYVEGEAYAAAVLVKRMGEEVLDVAPVWSDVRTFDGRPWRGKVDCVTAGYPCQPFSTAGQRRGEQDERHLWPSVKRVVEEIRPTRCFFENVSGHLSLGFEVVANDLRTMGYKVAAGLFSAEEVGAFHKRERCFIMADCDDSSSARFLEDNRLLEEEEEGLRGGAAECGCRVVLDDRNWTFPPRHTDRLAWGRLFEILPDLKPAVCRMDDGVPNQYDRLRACGNAVVPLVAAYAWRVLEDSLKVER